MTFSANLKHPPAPSHAKPLSVREELCELFKDAARSQAHLHQRVIDDFRQHIQSEDFRQQFFITQEAPEFLRVLARTSELGQQLCVEILKTPEGIPAIDERNKSHFLTTRCLLPVLQLLTSNQKAELLLLQTKNALGGGFFGAQDNLCLAANLAAWGEKDLLTWIEHMRPEQKSHLLSAPYVAVCLIQNAFSEQNKKRVQDLLQHVPFDRRNGILSQAQAKNVSLSFDAPAEINPLRHPNPKLA
jgi:hypothetical protein